MVYKFRLSPKVDNILLHKGIQAKSKASLNIIIYLKHKSYQFYHVAVYTFLILSPQIFHMPASHKTLFLFTSQGMF